MTVQPTTETPTPTELVSRLSLERKAELTAGARLWWTNAAPEIGLEPVKVSDGPHGVRGERFDERDVASCTPCGTALAASWDPGVVSRVGALVGEDASRRGIHVVLGPTMNIHRSPLGGRGFECYSEDPLLNGSIATGWIAGVQSRGVAATPKHFVCNDAETSRTTVDCIVDERALREIYLVPFELAAKAGAWALMTGYNRVNGAYISRALVTEILKDEWQWDGLAMSDWFALGDTVGWANGGLDLEMPGPARLFGSPLLDAVRRGEVDESTLDDKVSRLLTLAARVGRLNGSVTPPAPRQVAPAGADMEDRRWSMSAPADASDFGGFAPGGDILIEAAAASFVLLKNDAGLLPLQPVQKLAVIGPNAHDPAYQGGGSAHVNLRDVPTPLDAIRNAFSAEVTHEPGDAPRLTLPGLHKLVDGLDLEYFLPGELEAAARETRDASSFIWQEDLPGIGAQSRGMVRVSTTLTPAESGAYLFSVRGSSDCRLRVAGRDVAAFTPGPDERGDGALFSLVDARGEAMLTAGEPVLVEVETALFQDALNGLTLGCRPPQPADPIDRAAQAARDADAVVLIVGTSEDVERESDDRTTTALPGEQEELIRRVLEANPATIVVVNAASAVDMAWARDASTVLYAWYPGEAFGPALVDVLTGTREPGGRLPITIGRRHEDYGAWNTTPIDGRLEYPESVFVGYRHFDAHELEPEFCFGHGLGYGEWAYDAVRVDGLSVEVDVRNAGNRPAKEIVQLYVAADDARIPRPPRELRAFAPVTLEPGETTTVSFELDERAFAYWDSGWRADPGRYRILVGRSSRDIRLSEEVVLEDVGGVLSVRSMTAAETQEEEQ
jgi:beta-glucosidase